MKIKSRKGFTLVEILLTMIIIAAISLVMGRILISGMDSFSLVTERREALQGARLAVNIMSNELRGIANPAADISSISSSSITFKNALGNQVAYQISGVDLLRNGKQLASDLAPGSGFSYYTSGGVSTSNPAQVYRIGISVKVSSSAHGVVETSSGIYLRNRYYVSFSKN